MQQRHQNRTVYFKEQALTCNRYYIPYLKPFINISPDLHILEIGCGEGGNLLPFAKIGCHVTGLDLNTGRIKEAISFFQQEGVKGEFLNIDIFDYKPSPKNSFNLIILHDVIEHIADKKLLLYTMKQYLTSRGIIFIAFPSWQMPFGGHQQICHNSLISHLPFIHLLPRCLYKKLLKLANESSNCIEELMHIYDTRTTIRLFENLINTDYQILNRQFWFINPHYETKFHLPSRKLWKGIEGLAFLRAFCSTSCWYIIKDKSLST
jgi:SAM-dependent methyltransferase